MVETSQSFRVHTFSGKVAVRIGESQTLYVSRQLAQALAGELLAAASRGDEFSAIDLEGGRDTWTDTNILWTIHPVRHPNGEKDTRYDVNLEWCGHSTMQYVARFCGDWIGRSPLRREATTMCVDKFKIGEGYDQPK